MMIVNNFYCFLFNLLKKHLVTILPAQQSHFHTVPYETLYTKEQHWTETNTKTGCKNNLRYPVKDNQQIQFHG